MNNELNELAYLIAKKLGLNPPPDLDFSTTHFATEKRCYTIAKLSLDYWNDRKVKHHPERKICSQHK